MKALARSPTVGISIAALQELVDERHGGNVSAAAKAWSLQQSHVCRVLKGERRLRASVVQQIAKKERISAQALLEPQARKPMLAVLGTDRGSGGRLVYDVNDPAGMLLQVQSWFADVPNKDGMRSHVIRETMRTIFDHSFDEVHKPTPQWRTVMSRVEGWVPDARGVHVRRGGQPW